MDKYNFDLSSSFPISSWFVNEGIYDFLAACDFVHHLAYGRNSDKNDIFIVLKERKGSCSSKHALLKRLAEENGHPEVKLMLCIFFMEVLHYPKLNAILSPHGLKGFPEAHNYLRIGSEKIDITFPPGKGNPPIDLIEEIEIGVDQVTDFKVQYHQKYLKQWLHNNPHYTITPDFLWSIREQCIEALSR